MAKKPSSTSTGLPAAIIDPVTADDFFARGWAHYSKKEYFRAESDFRKALELTPNHPDGMFGLAQALQASGRPQDAVEAYEKLIRLLENNPAPGDIVRYHMLARLARGHVNFIKTGDWSLGL
jgi:tetratricopeptide (TPR) repeat protein